MLGFARMGTSQTSAVIRRYSALVDGALLKVRSDRPEMAQYCTNMLQAATSNCACARLSVRNVGQGEVRGIYLPGTRVNKAKKKAGATTLRLQPTWCEVLAVAIPDKRGML